MTAKGISRRQFVKSGGALVVSFSLSPATGWLKASQSGQELTGFKPLGPEEVDSWLAISQDGEVTVYTGKVDLGTGVETAFAQIVAEELDVAFERVKMIMGDTALTPDQGKSTGSRGISIGSPALQTAATEARQFLLNLASEHLRAPTSELEVKDGVINLIGNASRQVSYGELIGGKRFDIQLDVTSYGDPINPKGPVIKGMAQAKSPDQYTLVGQSVPRVDIPAKVAGSFEFVQDVRLPGMLHGRVVRPAAIGATLVSLDESSVQHIPGLVQVVRKANFIAVVAQREEQAIQAARTLKATWSDWEGLPKQEDLYETVRQSPVIEDRVSGERGDVKSALAAASKTLEATYEWPLQMHAMIGPSCAVADVGDNRATIWSGTQWPHGDRRDLARLLGIPEENVRVIWVKAAGCYGRLGCDDAAADAALLSQAVGRPVRVQWMRHDEHGWEPSSPAMVMDIRAGLDAQGKVVGWDYEEWSQSHANGERGDYVAWRLLGTAPGWSRLSGGGGGHPYRFPNQRILKHYVEPLMRAIYLRAPGSMQNNFAIESFMDELAVAAGVDPIEFRLRYLENPFSTEALKAVAQKTAWVPQPQPRQNQGSGGVVQGRGVAFADRGRGRGTLLAAIAQVEVNRDSGQVRVQNVTAASHCGRIINPDGVKNQLEGGILQGISRTLLEEIGFDQSRVTSLDWRAYPILTFPEASAVDLILLDRPNDPPEGVGELGNIPVAAAIGNAIFNATGVRLRQVPFTPARVKAALDRA